MSEEVLNIILEEEKKAAALLQDAQGSVNEIVKNAESQAADTERKAAVEHRALYHSLLEERRFRVEQLLKDGQADNVSRAADEIVKAEGRLAPAARYIVDEVLHGAG